MLKYVEVNKQIGRVFVYTLLNSASFRGHDTSDRRTKLGWLAIYI